MTSPLHRLQPRRLAAVAAVVLLAASAASCSTSGANATGSKGYVAGDGSVVIIKPSDRQRLPDISGPAVGGGTVSIDDHEGKVIVVNVWGSWCGPCRSEAPDLATAANTLKTAAFVGINTRDTEAGAEAFIRTQRIPYPSLRDQDGSAILKLYGLVHVSALPTTLVADRSGRIAAAIYGPTTTTTIVDLVHEIQGQA